METNRLWTHCHFHCEASVARSVMEAVIFLMSKTAKCFSLGEKTKATAQPQADTFHFVSKVFCFMILFVYRLYTYASLFFNERSVTERKCGHIISLSSHIAMWSPKEFREGRKQRGLTRPWEGTRKSTHQTGNDAVFPAANGPRNIRPSSSSDICCNSSTKALACGPRYFGARTAQWKLVPVVNLE